MEQKLPPQSPEEMALSGYERWAQAQAAASNGEMRVLDKSHDEYPKRIVSSISSPRQSQEFIDNVARGAQGRYDELLGAFEQSDNTAEVLSEAQRYIDMGYSVITLSPHSHIADVVIAQAAVLNQIQPSDPRLKTGVIINQMVRFLEFNLHPENDPEGPWLPITQALGYGEDTMIFTSPRTGNAKKYLEGVDPDYMDTINAKPVKITENAFESGHFLMAAATSGTGDEEVSPGVWQMAAATKGTIDLITKPKTVAIGMAIHYHSEKPILEAVGLPTELRTADDVHDLKEGIANRLTERLDDRSYYYDRPAA